LHLDAGAHSWKQNSKKNTVRDVCIDINEFKNGFNLELTQKRVTMIIYLQFSQHFNYSGRITTVIYGIYMGLMTLGPKKYTELSRMSLNLLPSKLRWILKC